VRLRRRRSARPADDDVTFDFVEPVVFAVLSIGVIAGGVAVVMLNRITAAALLMAFTFLSMAGMFVLLGAETIAAFQVLIYVGAITVLILYGVMFTKFSTSPRALFFQKQTPLAAVFVAAVAVPIVIVATLSFTGAPPRPGGGDLPALATSVFTDFAFPVVIASVLLLAAMVGAIVLTKRDDQEEAAARRRR